MKRILLYIINLYRKYVSGMKASPCCRFTPSCSNYAYMAVEEWGVAAGSVLAIARILRCNPLFPGGVDRIPLRGKKKYSISGYKVYYFSHPESKKVAEVRYRVKRRPGKCAKFCTLSGRGRYPKNFYMIYLTRGIENNL